MEKVPRELVASLHPTGRIGKPGEIADAVPRGPGDRVCADELGFGALDTQALEVALGALDSLQATGCQVGIISHVDGIAERIGAQVAVIPEGGGQSRVAVRAR